MTVRHARWAGLGGLALAGFGWWVDPVAFYGAWLGALAILAAWSLGSVALLLIHALTGGRWGELLHAGLARGVRALPVLVVAALPLAAGLPALYDWARPRSHVVDRAYLNVPFFAGRAAFYLAAWLLIGGLVLRGRALDRIAPAALFVLGLTVSFAAVDTVLSLQPGFVSSIFGMMVAVGMVLFALSVAVATSADKAPASVWADLGKLLLALVILSAYLDFMQLLIIWQSNLPTEARYYLDRTRGVWGAARALIAVLRILLPIALLLAPGMQRLPRLVRGVAALLVVAEVVRTWWMVLPSLHRLPGWIDVACLVGLAGTAWATTDWMRRWPKRMGGVHV